MENAENALHIERPTRLLELQRPGEYLTRFAPSTRKAVDLIAVSHDENFAVTNYYASYRGDVFERRQLPAQITTDSKGQRISVPQCTVWMTPGSCLSSPP